MIAGNTGNTGKRGGARRSHSHFARRDLFLMTKGQEQVLIELVERGPLTWFRLDALLGAAGFQLGPALFAEIDQLRISGLLEIVEEFDTPKRYQIAAGYELEAACIARAARAPF